MDWSWPLGNIPDPVSPTTIVVWLSRIDCRSCFLDWRMGNITYSYHSMFTQPCWTVQCCTVIILLWNWNWNLYCNMRVPRMPSSVSGPLSVLLSFSTIGSLVYLLLNYETFNNRDRSDEREEFAKFLGIPPVRKPMLPSSNSGSVDRKWNCYSSFLCLYVYSMHRFTCASNLRNPVLCACS